MRNNLDQQQFNAVLDAFPGGKIVVNDDVAPSPFHLFHAANSVCSQKVRATLFFHEMSFISHDVNIFLGRSYAPEYVRMRMIGCAAAGMPLSTHHSGSTSAQKTGCDACVVPTLIDDRNRNVVVDSIRICFAVDDGRPKGQISLVPMEFRDDILTELDLVDELPNYPLLGAAIAKKSNYNGQGNPFASSKVARCERLIKENADDADLVTAYKAKRDKELSADRGLFSEAALELSRAKMADAMSRLEARLDMHEGTFLFGDTPTLADIYWAVELVRSDDLSMDGLWSAGALPRVAEYYARLCALPAIKLAILDWPEARLDFKM